MRHFLALVQYNPQIILAWIELICVPVLTGCAVWFVVRR